MKHLLIIIWIFLSTEICAAESFSLYLNRNRLAEVTDFSFLPDMINKNMLTHLPMINWVDENNYTIFPMKETVYAIRGGFFDVLMWQDSAWVNLYKSHFYGHTFGAKIFTSNQNIYSLGAYGYWHGHSDLLQFSNERGFWEIIPNKDCPDNYYSACYSKIGDTLLSLFGFYDNQSTNTHKNEDHGFFLDLKNHSWNKLTIELDHGPIVVPFNSDKNILDLNDYLVFNYGYITQTGFIIINKKDFTINFWPTDFLSFKETPFVLLKGNKVCFHDKSEGISKIDFNKGINEAAKIGYIKLSAPRTNLIWFYIILMIILVFFVIIYFFMHKRSKSVKIQHIRNNEIKDDGIDILIKKFSSKLGETIDTTVLDCFLEIDNTSYDNKRVKRSRLIKEINSRYMSVYGYTLINRKKDFSDKRYMTYYIGRV